MDTQFAATLTKTPKKGAWTYVVWPGSVTCFGHVSLPLTPDVFSFVAAEKHCGLGAHSRREARMLRRLSLFVLAGVLALAAASPSLASTQPAAGTFTEGPEMITDEREADGNLIIELTRAVVFTGTYDGAGQAEQRIVIHKDGSANVHMTITFTGLACGQPAALVFLIEGQVQFDENFLGPITGTYTVIDSGRTDDRTLRGHGEFEGLAGIGGVYEGEAHCD
jgi:hypothetical protein